MSARAEPPDSSLGSIEALKRVKETESEWELKLRDARSTADAALERLRAESEAAVQASQEAADRERAAAVLTARQEAEREAAEILAGGLGPPRRRPVEKGNAPRTRRTPSSRQCWPDSSRIDGATVPWGSFVQNRWPRSASLA